jgi:hypothetical protein
MIVIFIEKIVLPSHHSLLYKCFSNPGVVRRLWVCRIQLDEEMISKSKAVQFRHTTLISLLFSH